MTSLSARQFQMLKALLNDKRLTDEGAAALNQTTLNSFVRRGYLKATGTHQLSFTENAAEALREFDHAEIYRKAAKANLGSYVQAALGVIQKRRRVA